MIIIPNKSQKQNNSQLGFLKQKQDSYKINLGWVKKNKKELSVKNKDIQPQPKITTVSYEKKCSQ